MNKKMFYFLPFISFFALADDVPNTFASGAPIIANEVNANFQSVDSRLDNVETQIQTVIGLLEAASSGRAQLVGFTAPAVFGSLGPSNGASMCNAVSIGSHVCNIDEVETIVDWGALTQLTSPVFLIGNENQSTPCYAYSDRNVSSGSFGTMSGGQVEAFKEVRGMGAPIAIESEAGMTLLNALDLNLENPGYDSGYGLHLTENENMYNTAGTQSMVISACNITIQAACCK